MKSKTDRFTNHIKKEVTNPFSYAERSQKVNWHFHLQIRMQDVCSAPRMSFIDPPKSLRKKNIPAIK